MKIKITPCICTQLKNDGSESVYAGMPQLRVTNYNERTNSQFYEPYCPACGRGGLISHKSPYLRLKHWNELQNRVKRQQKLFEGDTQ